MKKFSTLALLFTLVFATPEAKATTDPFTAIIQVLIGGGAIAGAAMVGIPLALRHLLRNPALHTFLTNQQAFDVLIRNWNSLTPAAQRNMRRFAHKAAANGNAAYKSQIEFVEKSSAAHQ